MKKQLLLLVMILLPVLASAADIEVPNANGKTIYYNYTNNGTELAVTSGNTKYTGNIVIPDEVTYMTRTFRVTIIGSGAFKDCSGLTSVTLPNNLKSIDSGAFYGCSKLTSIIIPNSVTSIGNGAFSGCSGLTSITIPNSVISIGSSAFYKCYSLSSISFGNGISRIGNTAFDGCRLKNVLTLNVATTLDNGAFTDRTYQHAMLYIPEGTWASAVYGGSWYLFNNIREVAMNKEKLSPAKGYALMDTKSFGYAVFDETSNEVKIAEAFYSMDENDLNNCWQVIDKSGAKYLYNIGAKKYAKISSDGEITLTNYETPVNITEGENGLKFGSNTSREWGFVKNNNVTIDNQTDIKPVSRTGSESSSTYFTLDGQQTSLPKKGLNILRMSNGTIKKVIMKQP